METDFKENSPRVWKKTTALEQETLGDSSLQLHVSHGSSPGQAVGVCPSKTSPSLCLLAIKEHLLQRPPLVSPGKVLCDGKFTKGAGCPSTPRPAPWFSDLGPEERKGKSQPCRGSSTQSDSRLLQLNSQKDGLCWSSCRKPSLGLGAGNHISSVLGKPSCLEHSSLLQLSHFWWAARGESSKQRPTPGNTPRGKT